jgi:hypothetical protein
MVWCAEKQDGEKVKVVIDAVLLLQENVKSVDELQLDRVEFAYLKALVLFSPDRVLGRGRRVIKQLQEEVCRELQDHEHARDDGEGEGRVARLLLCLPALRLLSADTLEHLFFTGLIGNVQIDSILPFILRMDPSEYSLHIEGQGHLNVPDDDAHTSSRDTDTADMSPSYDFETE